MATPSFDMVHMSTSEIPKLFKIQGDEEFAPHTHIPMFKNLEKLLRNKDATHRILDYHDQNMRSGRGHALIRDRADLIRQAKKMSPQGRNGDNTVALIGKHTEGLLDHLLGANHGYPPTNVNPHSGKKEYWGLGKFFDGLVHGVGNVVKKIPIVGGLVHNVASGLGNTLGYHNSQGVAEDQARQQQQQDPNQQQQYGPQQDPNQQQPGGGGGWGDMLHGAANMYDQYQQGGMQGMANNFMNQMGQSQDPYMQAAHSLMNGYNQGGFGGMANAGMQHMMNSPGGGMPDFMNPYMQQGQQMYNQMQPYMNMGNQMYDMYNQMQQPGGGGYGGMLHGAGDMMNQYGGGGGGGGYGGYSNPSAEAEFGPGSGYIPGVGFPGGGLGSGPPQGGGSIAPMGRDAQQQYYGMGGR